MEPPTITTITRRPSTQIPGSAGDKIEKSTLFFIFMVFSSILGILLPIFQTILMIVNYRLIYLLFVQKLDTTQSMDNTIQSSNNVKYNTIQKLYKIQLIVIYLTIIALFCTCIILSLLMLYFTEAADKTKTVLLILFIFLFVFSLIFGILFTKRHKFNTKINFNFLIIFTVIAPISIAITGFYTKILWYPLLIIAYKSLFLS